MIPQWWSWLLASIGITGFWLSGSGKRTGWAVNVLVQPLWLAYALTTKQWGFIVTTVAYGTVFGRNWWRWRKAKVAA